jgi:hypothetical protein
VFPPVTMPGAAGVRASSGGGSGPWRTRTSNLGIKSPGGLAEANGGEWKGPANSYLPDSNKLSQTPGCGGKPVRAVFTQGPTGRARAVVRLLVGASLLVAPAPARAHAHIGLAGAALERHARALATSPAPASCPAATPVQMITVVNQAHVRPFGARED